MKRSKRRRRSSRSADSTHHNLPRTTCQSETGEVQYASACLLISQTKAGHIQQHQTSSRHTPLSPFSTHGRLPASQPPPIAFSRQTIPQFDRHGRAAPSQDRMSIRFLHSTPEATASKLLESCACFHFIRRAHLRRTDRQAERDRRGCGGWLCGGVRFRQNTEYLSHGLWVWLGIYRRPPSWRDGGR